MLSFGHAVLGTDLKFNDTEEKLFFPDHAIFEINSLIFFFQEWKKKFKPEAQSSVNFNTLT